MLPRIESLVRDRLGLEPRALGSGGLERLVGDRMRHLGYGEPWAYAERLERDPDEVRRLGHGLLVHETWFFRYPASFRTLLAAARARRLPGDAGPLRILSAPCATGEEAVSIAVALLQGGLPAPRFEVLALDVSEDAIRAARTGTFRAASLRGPLPEGASAFLRRDGGRVAVARAVLDRVRFEVADVLAESFPSVGRFPAVFCRNLLIYLTDESRVRLVENLRRVVAEGGLLFVGHAEVGAFRAPGFEPVRPPDAFALGHAPERPSAQPAPLLPAAGRPRGAAPAVRGPAPARRRERPGSPPPPPAPDVPAEAARLADRGELAAALALLEQEVSAGRVSADHFHLMGVIHSAAGRPTQAEAALGRALYLDPAHYEALLCAALLAERRGEPEAARRLRQRAARAHREPLQ
jgi:chemotaxis protein methyltransferase WspC